MADVPMGWFLWPNMAGELEVKDPLMDVFVVHEGCSQMPEEIVADASSQDAWHYTVGKEKWKSGETEHDGRQVTAAELFFAFEEFTKGREVRGKW